MLRIGFRRIAAIVGMFVCAPGAWAQIPEGWEIVEIAPAGTEFGYGREDINDRGEVVFSRWSFGQRETLEILCYHRGESRRLTDDALYDNLPRINNHGQIVWMRDLDADAPTERIGIVEWQPSEPRILIDEPDSPPNLEDINDSGLVVWSKSLTSGDGPFELFVYDGSDSRQITNNGLWNLGAHVNQRGDIVWTRYDFRVSPWTSEVLAYFPPNTITLSSGQRQIVCGGLNDTRHVIWDSLFNGVELWVDGRSTVLLDERAIAGSINGNNDVSIARWDGEKQNFMLWMIRKGQLIQITDATGGGGSGQINQRGEVAFITGRFPSHGLALFTKTSYVADIDYDGDVDLADVALFQRSFGCVVEFFTDECSKSDINNDGVVDNPDLTVVSKHFRGPE